MNIRFFTLLYVASTFETQRLRGEQMKASCPLVLSESCGENVDSRYVIVINDKKNLLKW